MDTFPLEKAPDWGLESNPEADVEEQKLGDGYILRRAKGINHIRESWSPSWGFLEHIECQATYNWLKQRLKLEPFLWVHPTDGTVYKVVCQSVSMVVSDVGIYALKANFVQDFNL